jgi:ribosomal protein S18 acetylase RimI-like enzyme
MDLTADISGHAQVFLDLEFQASAPYTSFVFSSPEQALEVRQYLLEKKLCEFSPPYGRLLCDAGQPLGMLAVLSGKELGGRRLKAAHALTRSDFLERDPGLGARLQLAGRTLLKLLPDDLYISRVATVPAARGRGIGTRLIQEAEREARGRGCHRLVLEVSPTSTAAVQLYQRTGFEQIDSKQVVDPLTQRSLHYLHLVKHLG